MITKEEVLRALSHVEDPDFKKDLVTLNMIKDIVITADSLSFSVELTTPACPMKEHLERACRNAITHFVSKDITVNKLEFKISKNADLQSQYCTFIHGPVLLVE